MNKVTTQHMLLRISIILSCTLLSSCSRYLEWGKQTFKQADNLPTEQTPIEKSLKSIRVYNDFNTVLLADALWLTMPTREAFVNMRSCRQAYTDTFHTEFLRKQHEEHAQKTSFYVIIGPVSDKTPVISQTDSTARWSMSLCVDGNIYVPHQVKPIELEPEYEYFLRKIDQTHRDIFLVTFNAPIPDDKKITLNFRSVMHEASCTWNE